MEHRHTGTDPRVLRGSEAELLRAVAYELKRVIVGQDRALERILVCLLAGGHCLLEGVPGLAKTLMVRTLAEIVGGRFTRIQFTPDLVPSDIVGTRIYLHSREEFAVEPGPVLTNFLLADEVNRAPAKVQSALLEAMGEQQVSIGGRTFPAPEPFLVLATQNPIESEGVYRLPEAQRDRFLMKLVLGYPDHGQEFEIARRMTSVPPSVQQVLTPRRVMALQRVARQVYVDPAVLEYAVRLVLATREPAAVGLPDLKPLLAYGASPRATIGLIRAARAHALLSGRGYALPGDVRAVAPEILRHRLLLSYEAIADGRSAEDLLPHLLEAVAPPETVPHPAPATA